MRKEKQNMKLLILFIALNIANVVIQTVKSLATIKCGKTVAAIVNAIAYGLYTVVVVYTVCDLDLWIKVLVVGIANLIGVYIVKLIEEKTRKDKLWRIEFVVRDNANIERYLQENNISFTRLTASDNKNKFEIYCKTQDESLKVKQIIDKYNIKYFVNESKVL